MKNIHKIKPGNYYLFESLSSANSIFFDSEEEISIFKKLIRRFLSKFADIHKIFVDVNGYQILIRIRQKRTLTKHYVLECQEREKPINTIFLKEPWKIISEKMRIFKSLYVRTINKIRGREGVLVKHSFKKYYFESAEEYGDYIKKMEKSGKIRSQKNNVFSKMRKDTKIKKWVEIRAQKWFEEVIYKGFTSLVALKLIYSTLSHHNPRHNSHSHFHTPLINIKGRRMNR